MASGQRLSVIACRAFNTSSAGGVLGVQPPNENSIMPTAKHKQ
jgi:hypothetical protein